MIKKFINYISKGQYRMAKIYLHALFIWYKIMFIRWANRTYKKLWPFILLFFISLWSYCAYLKMKYDYSLIENYAHFEALSSDYYTKWMTDGSPGQDPPPNQ